MTDTPEDRADLWYRAIDRTTGYTIAFFWEEERMRVALRPYLRNATDLELVKPGDRDAGIDAEHWAGNALAAWINREAPA